MLARYSVRQNPEQEKTKNVDQAKWNDLISRQAADKSTPPSAEGPQGLGDWRWLPHFRTITWQVPGSMGFVGSKRETKHHLWNCNLIDCCSHYPVKFLKLLRAWGEEESERNTEEEVGGRREKKIWCSAVQSPWSPVHLSCSSETDRQAAEKESKRSSPKEPLIVVFSPCSGHTQLQSELQVCVALKLDHSCSCIFQSC